MFFELIGGNHEENGKKYTKGDVFESDKNLFSMFRGKFRKVSKDGSPPPVKVPKIPTKESSPPESETGASEKLVSGSIKTRLGPDITASFLEAKGTEFKIHKAAGEKYHIVNGKSDVFGGDGFTRSEVLIFLNNA